jgi:hypothetical protein
VTKRGIVYVHPSDAGAPAVSRASGLARPSYPQAKMVGWYDPGQLARTGASVAVSTVFGRNSDQRTLEALRAAPIEYFDYSVDDAGAPRRELWIDYVADAGDGFDSTYAIASAIAHKALDVSDPTGARHTTERGRILVFGGDLVYPVAQREQYEQKLVMPYEQALPSSTAPHPDLYAVPGNHDWYDSLVSFTRRFCSKRWFAGWRTQQSVSYFALQLPHDWWLLGTDVQLDSDIDADQVDYFKAVAAQMTDSARIILCNAEPNWIYEKKYAKFDKAYLDNKLQFLEERVFHRRIAVFLAGDLHHYRRHSDGRDHHKIVAGGGGAFLHATHGGDVATLPGLTGEPPYQLACSYPAPKTSRRLTWRNLVFPVMNPWFGLVTALLYLLTVRAVDVQVATLGLGEIAQVADRVVCATLRGPTALFWIAAVVAGIVLFTDTHSKRYRMFGGVAHAITHLAAVFFVGWGAAWLVGRAELPAAAHLVSIGALVFAAGWIIGPIVLGIYLFVSLNVFGRHHNEAFSSLAIPDWKNFLRLHIDAQGTLRIYPIGIDRVPRTWRPASSGPRLVSGDRRATPPRLIEPPIAIPNGESSQPGRPKPRSV